MDDESLPTITAWTDGEPFQIPVQIGSGLFHGNSHQYTQKV